MVHNLNPLLPILMVDDEASWLRSLSITLKRSAGFNNTIQCHDSREVMNILAGQEVSLILLDLMMPHLTGEELLPQIVEKHPGVPVIILSGMNQVESAVRCIKAGAFDYFVKAAEVERMILGMQRALQMRELQNNNRTLTNRFIEAELKHPEAFVTSITRSERMKAVFRYIEAVSASSEPLLISGESGTGKELIAKSYHRICCPAAPWIPVSLGGMNEEDLSASLFGQVRGGRTPGLIPAAKGGVLFLDEIGDLSQSAQSKLLRLVREGEYTPVGADRPQRLEARIVCTTNQDLEARVALGEFRRDLYFKLQTHHVRMPPLRERKEDIPLLLGHFLDEASRSLKKKRPAVPEELPYLLATYYFPGNVQELRAMVFSALATHQARTLSMDSFKRAIGFNDRKREPGVGRNGNVLEDRPPMILSERLPTLTEAANFLVHEALRRSNNNQSIAAGLLGITRQALSQRLKKLRDAEKG